MARIPLPVAATLAFAAAASGTIVGPLVGAGWAARVCKPLLMPVLLVWFRLGAARLEPWLSRLVTAALLGSWAGDVALMFDGAVPALFLGGLAAFLVAQLCYATAFAGQALAGPPDRWGLILAVTIGAAGGLVALRVVRHVSGPLVVPVALYALAIIAMGVMAALRLGRTSRASFAAVFVGAVLFLTSDSLLATNRFVGRLPHARWSVMLTYTLGQYLIVAGCLGHRPPGGGSAGAPAVRPFGSAARSSTG